MAQDTAIEKRETQTMQTEHVRSGQTFVPNVDILEQDNELLLLAGKCVQELDLRKLPHVIGEDRARTLCPLRLALFSGNSIRLRAQLV